MKKFMLLFAMVASVAGCPKKKGADDALAQMETFKNQMCACKDAACTKDVTDKMTKWAADHKQDGKPGDMTDDQKKKASAISDELAKCMMAQSMPATPPAGSAAAPAGSDSMAGSAAAGSAMAGSAMAGSDSMAGSAAGSAAAGSAAK